MTKTQLTQAAALASLALLLPLGGARAQTYVKQGMGGDLLSNAFEPFGTIGGPLTEIDGTFSTSSATSTQGVPDLYLLDLTARTAFSATTVGTPGTAYDTQLFLFNASGYGVYENFLDGSQVLPGGIQIGAGATLPADYLPAGIYYLGIAPEGAEPQSAGGNIFPNPLADGVSMTDVYGPTGAGGSGPLTKWSITSDDVDSGSYTITLTGAAFAVPESPVLALIGLGLLPLALAIRRRISTGGAADTSSERTHV